MTTKLEVWNNALGELGHNELADTGEPVESARRLTRAWAGVLEECVAAGSWNFAMETVQLDADTGVTPEFGYPKVFAKPSDWLRTISISEDPYFAQPLLHYYDDSNFWSADNTPIYVRYVSSDTGLGYDLSRWGSAFTRYVELELASQVCMRLTQKRDLKADIDKGRDKARKTAKNQDAMNEGTKFPPPSSWTMARGGRNGGRRERGSTGNLTG